MGKEKVVLDTNILISALGWQGKPKQIFTMCIGGEFELLKRMLEQNLIARCKNIQVQFHDFYPNARELRDELRTELAKTHELTYDYYFVMENWRRKPQA
ncbi:MAG: hypothetical protein V1644_02660 [Candidatus Micrarchaeota archaeon]